MDNDAKILEEMGHAVVDMQVKYRSSPLKDRMLLKPALEELLNDYAKYQVKLLKEGTISTEADLAEAQSIRADIDKAAKTEALLKAVARSIAFVALKV